MNREVSCVLFIKTFDLHSGYQTVRFSFHLSNNVVSILYFELLHLHSVLSMC